MKTSLLKFNPGRAENAANRGTVEVLPAIIMPDGSEILLHGFDRACRPNQHQRRKKKLPALDVRNELGARAVELLNLMDKRSSATILAALRYYQNDMDNGKRLSRDVDDGGIHDIATDGGTLRALTATQIDELCDKINR